MVLGLSQLEDTSGAYCSGNHKTAFAVPLRAFSSPKAGVVFNEKF
jgi:hypothetical protein